MKNAKCLLMVFAALAGTILVADLTVNAQSGALRVNIPFEFHVGEKALPAGTYIVEKRGDALLISDRASNSAAILSNAIGNKARGLDNMVVFHRYGDSRFLSEVRWSEYSTARGVLPSKAERRLAGLIPAETVKLAAIVR
jgi:hypothetical protein